jgi:hypothetical protein
MPKYNMKFSTDREIHSLQNQIFKLLPLYEGIDMSGKVIYDEINAHINFKKNLTLLINKVVGASSIWFENQYFADLLYQLEGLSKYDYSHAEIRQIIFYCTNDLCEKMKLMEGVRNG